MQASPARWEDIPRLITYISAFHQASPWANHAFSPGCVRTCLQHMIGAPDHCVFIHDHGAIGGRIAPMMFGPDRFAQEMFWWAERDGLALFTAFEGWAKDNDAAAISMASLPESRVEAIYKRRGYNPSEQYFTKAI